MWWKGNHCALFGCGNLCIHYGKQQFSKKKLKIRVPYDPVVPLPGIYLKKTKTPTGKDICPTVFIAAQFAVIKTWTQRKYPLMDEEVKKMWHIYTMEYYSAFKKKEILTFKTTWMDF